MRLDFLRRQALARQILMALAPAAACGGTAVIDGAEGSGGAGGNPSTNASTVATSVATTGTGGFTCNVPVPEHTELVYACLPPQQNVCPAKDDVVVLNALNMELGGSCTDPASCWCHDQSSDLCDCYNHVPAVPCGPDPTAVSTCCYYALVATDLVCEGRPFVIDGEPCTAPAVSREDWLLELTPSCQGLDAATRQALAEAWTADGLAEHASVASFARFVLELLAVGAPADLVRDAQRALADEIAHAEISFGLASAYAGTPVGPGPLAMPSEPLRSSLAEIAVATAREGCINETLAALCVQAAHDEARDGAVKTALAAIAADEARHATLAWRFVAWAIRQDATVSAAVEAVFASTRFDFAGKDAPRGPLADHGQLSAEQRTQLLRDGFDEVVIPCAYELLAHRGSTEIAAGWAGV